MIMGVKLEIWCPQYHVETSEILARRCFWPTVPRIGEKIVIWDGWAAETVREVIHEVDRNIITIWIGPDLTGEYAKRAEKEQQSLKDSQT